MHTVLIPEGSAMPLARTAHPRGQPVAVFTAAQTPKSTQFAQLDLRPSNTK